MGRSRSSCRFLEGPYVFNDLFDDSNEVCIHKFYALFTKSRIDNSDGVACPLCKIKYLVFCSVVGDEVVDSSDNLDTYFAKLLILGFNQSLELRRGSSRQSQDRSEN